MTETASWVAGTAVIVAAVVAGVVVVGRVARWPLRRRPALLELTKRTRVPGVAMAGLAAVRARLEDAPLERTPHDAYRQLATVALIATVAWLAVRSLTVLEELALGRFHRFDISPRDNLRARSLRTQIQVLRRVGVVIIVVVAGIVALRSFSWGREIGTSLLAASGIVGVVAGVCGRSTVGNVIAGLQIAFAEPIRIEDVVVVEDEWGNIEEITLTYVVVRLWDQRRLVLPTSYFVEQPFENWTRRGSELLGVIELWTDYSVPVDAVRAELDRLVAGSELWDGRTAVLQVTDASPQALKLRALVSAPDGPTAWNLRCEVREGLARWLATHRPDALPQVRTRNGTAATAAAAAGRDGATG